MENASTSNNQKKFKGTFITLRPRTDRPFKWPDIQILSISTEYQLLKNSLPAHDPEKKLTGMEFQNEINSFIDYYKNNLSGKSIVFSADHAMKYNIKNGLIAVYSHDRISVAKIPCVWEETLKIIGYTLDTSLPVPFSNSEAYYDEYRDELLAIW